MATNSHHMHRISQLSTSTMDDDSLFLTRRQSLADLDSLYAEPSATTPFTKSILFEHDTECNDIGDPAMLMVQPGTADQVLRHANPSTIEPVTMEAQSSLDAIVSPEPCHRNLDDLDCPRAILERPTSDQAKRTKMSRLFSRAASNGDLQRIVDMLSNFRSWIDVEASLEEDGITPLIYAACFGHIAVIFMLLDAGAQIDARDRFGWTALIWATNNKHEHIVRLLLEHGASPAAQTSKGRTVADFLRHDPNDNTRIVEIFRGPSSRTSIEHLACDQNADKILLEDKWPYRITRGTTGEADAFETVAARRKSATGQVDGTEDFNWKICLPDQMFVFSSGDINRLIKTTITAMEITRSESFEPVPAYVLFLAARFAHHYSTPDLLDELLEAALSAIEFVTKCKTGDVAFIAYWISNTSVLLCLLRKDPGLDATSKIHQPKFEALLQDMIQMLIIEAEGGIDRILGPAMLEHDTIVGLKEVKFSSDWALGFWKAVGNGHITNRTYKRASAPQFNSPTPHCHVQRRTSMHIPRPLPPSQQSVAPRAVTTMLSSILYLMRSFDIHPEVVHYVVEQLLHYISCEIFNHMMENRRFLSRSKALQTRLNLSCLEDWLRNNQMPSRVSAQLAPLIQLLQLLQVLSQQTDLTTWIETRRTLGLLNHSQVRHVVSAYRYEVEENRLPVEITQYVVQVANDLERATRRSLNPKDAQKRYAERGSCSELSSARTSTSLHRADSRGSSESRTVEEEEEDEEDFDDEATVVSAMARSVSSGSKEMLQQQQEGWTLLSETRDSRMWIPFVIPSNLAARGVCVERVYVPYVPDDLLQIL